MKTLELNIIEVKANENMLTHQGTYGEYGGAYIPEVLQAQLDKLAKFLKSASVWILGIIMTLFVTILSLEGNITETVDGVTAKPAKAELAKVATKTDEKSNFFIFSHFLLLRLPLL